MIQYFLFEEDFVEDNIRCVPMIARFKLDACGIKLKLKEWSRMTEEERQALCEIPCSTDDEIQAYKQQVQEIIWNRTGIAAQEFTPETNPEWAVINAIPETVRLKLNELQHEMELVQWQSLSVLQQFVLVKLSRPGHENKNFPIAMREFGLL